MVASLQIVEGEAPVVGLEGEVGLIVPNSSKIANQACLGQEKWREHECVCECVCLYVSESVRERRQS